ncbi:MULTISPECIES: hypothetical protein [Methylorubrum]|jgi:hypothetical protein|uniref:Uncharacterized protein n=2 Tax=Methylorubrum extorquens TaxID=408 RepID=C5AQK6_METEA|nr:MULTISPECIES: hypothetical protein [Methylorubrum]ACS40103.1 hypothetical protein; putative exported protein [Methylorubrum extorquens AM1]EHP93180.1 hypothetical protein MetexDRAFT_1929 [Methylorubrum extorquens DSM 13060]MCP1541749.1 hypothetical protein [Methylorubrum extorquens]MCP1585714.1 hypothetical protein [Methylorubrum extorquens]BDL39710.1 hypothetical protein MSPGM_23000 [Methylorubrum sp. GM97]
MRLRKTALAALLILSGASAAGSQTVVDGSEAGVGAEATRTALSLIERQMRDPEAKVAGLRIGRAGALCGTVDLRNRMGAYTGSRPFVADLSEPFLGRLPEGPELRSPGSVGAFRAMERAKALFEANCTAG